MPRLFLSLLSLSVLLLNPVLAQAAESTQLVLPSLERDVVYLQREIAVRRGFSSRADEIPTLQQAVNILTDAGDCTKAQSLLQEVFARGWSKSAQNLAQYAALSACANRWDRASAAYYLAYRADQAAPGAVDLLWFLAQSLERRANSWNDYNAAAIEVLQLALQRRDDADFRLKLKQLREREQEKEPQPQVMSVYAEVERKSPALCLQFGVNMPAAEALQYADYIRFKPAFTPVWEINDKLICAIGAQFGESYRITLREGLRGLGQQAIKAGNYNVDVPDREPMLAFNTNRYVLPAQQTNSIPLTVVNVERIKMNVYQIHDRNLGSEFVRQYFLNEVYDHYQLANEIGEMVWSGEIDLPQHKNQQQNLALALPEKLKGFPGLFVVRVEQLEDDSWRAQKATQWLVQTDIGLASYQGRDELVVQARSLQGAKPLERIVLRLYSRNNSVIAERLTDSDGIARFSAALMRGKGPREATFISAHDVAHGYALLEVRSAPFDLSDRGVSGRAEVQPMEALLYTGRGVYRPGETVQINGLLRDAKGRAIKDRPLHYSLSNPDGETAEQGTLKAGPLGSYELALPFAREARSGRWQLSVASSAQSESLGEVGFLLEDIKPPRFEVKLATPKARIQPGEALRASVDAQYLFGAPAADLATRAWVELDVDTRPFPEYDEFRFQGADDLLLKRKSRLWNGQTDASGQLALELALPQIPNTSKPLKAIARVAVRDVDGRERSARAEVALSNQPLYLGLRKLRENASQQSQVEVVGLKADGSLLGDDALRWVLTRQHIDYQWVRDNGRWHFESQTRYEPIAQGEAALQAGKLLLNLPTDTGRYRLRVEHQATALASTLGFDNGRVQGPDAFDRPDQLWLEADRKHYQPGESAHLTIKGESGAQGTLVIATDKILSVRNFSLSGPQTSLNIPVSDDWGAGAYALVSLYQPSSGAVSQSVRAVGVAWLGIDPQNHDLKLSLSAPERVLPNQQQSVELSLGRSDVTQAYVTLYAVDDGVLQLTGFEAADPLEYFFGKRRLGVGLRDLYGRLIEVHEATPLKARGGAGGNSKRGMPESNIEIVSLYSGVQAFDRDGKARIKLDLPQFNGRVRLMALAWSEASVAAAQQAMTLSEPVVVDASMPRFLAQGDQAHVSVLLSSIDGPSGEYQFQASTTGALQLLADATSSFNLKAGQQKRLTVPLKALQGERGWLKLRLIDPQQNSREWDYKLGLRPPYLPQSERVYGRLQPGDTLSAPSASLERYQDQELQFSLGLSTAPAFDVAGLTQQLENYPHGCVEQLTSRALPLLQVERLRRDWKVKFTHDPQGQIESSIDTLFSRQHSDGGFGLWSRNDSVSEWASLYALEFILEAQQRGYPVASDKLQLALDWAAKLVDGDFKGVDEITLSNAAYAHYVLALAGRPDAENARYLVQQRLNNMPSMLAATQLAVALKIIGEERLSSQAFEFALKFKQRKFYWQDYGSDLRDRAATAALALQYGLGDVAELVQLVLQELANSSYLSTQEQAWLVRLAAMIEPAQSLDLQLADGSRITDKSWFKSWDWPALPRGEIISNRGSAPAWAFSQISGLTKQPPPALAEGYQIERQFFTASGEPVDLSQPLQQGDLLYVVINAKSTDDRTRQTLVVDPIPAGFEIDNPRLSGAENNADSAWLDELSRPRYSEARDDRYIAVLDLNGKQRFKLAYVVRALTPGRYTLPALEVEEMYQPQFRARSALQQIEIVAPQ